MEITIILITIAIIIEFPIHLTYGKYISNYPIDLDKYELNQSNHEILSCDSRKFIAKVPISLFSYYYINTIGVVLRWSKLHRDIAKNTKN